MYDLYDECGGSRSHLVDSMTKLDPQAINWRFWIYMKYAKWAAKAFVAAILPLALFAQQPAPNVQVNFGPWTDLTTSQLVFNAGSLQAAYWVLSYQVTGFSAISLQFESATGPAGSPGAFAAFSGTVTSGVNPSTSVACGTPTNCTAVFSGIVGWVRVRLVSKTGSGTIQGTLQGYKTYQALGGNSPAGGSGCPGTVGTPCVVGGSAANGAALAGNPVLVCGSDGTNCRQFLVDGAGRLQVVGGAPSGSALNGNPVVTGGSDGTNARYILVDASGRQIVVGGAASGSPVSGNPLLIAGFDGTNARSILVDGTGFLRVGGIPAVGAAVSGNPLLMGLSDGTNSQYAFYCPNQAAFSLAAATDVVIVAGTASKKTYICHIDFAASAAGTFTVQQGTGATCGTGTAAITGAMPSITSFAMNYTPQAALHTTTNANDTCLHAGGAATVGGFVTYAQF